MIIRLDDDLRRLIQSSRTWEDAVDWWLRVRAVYDGDGVRWLAKNDRFYLLTVLLHRPDAQHQWLYERCREVEADPDDCLDLWAREHYKAIDLNEPVPTPTGFKRHGDLKKGDWVFGSDGMPTRVVATTPVFTDAECYRVRFDDGYEVTVSGQHRWTVEQRSRRRDNVTGKRLCRESVVMDTEAMAVLTHEADSRLAVRVAPPVMQVEHILPISPYVLGAWLGDGHSAGARITCAYDDIEVIEQIRAERHVAVEHLSPNENTGLFTLDPGVRGQKGTGMTSELRLLGVINNKHIPRDYMVASIAQRRDLLQGLMDTDGHCNTRGTAIFVNKSKQLANDVFTLAASLGLKPRLNCFHPNHGDVYYVSFQSYKVDAPFRLARKLDRCKDGERVARRFITSVERVATVPVSCIQVEAANGLYLIGRNYVTTHNSTIITFAGIIQEIIRNPEITIGVFSHTKPISRKFMLQIKAELETNQDLIQTFPDIFYAEPKKESPKWSEEKGIVVKRRSNPKEATIEAWGLVDGQPTGAHYALRVYDDVVTRESVSTPEQVTKTTEAWSLSDNLGARGADGKSRCWHIGTRYSHADTYQYILDKKALKPRIYAATDNGLLDGNPVFLSVEAWAEKKRKQTSATLAAQMLQNPAAGAMAMFKKEWLRFADIRPATLNVYILCDPASSRKKGSDRTAIAVIGVDSARNKYLLDGYHHRMSLTERWLALSGLRKVWMNMPGVQLVRVGYERYGSTSDLEHFEEKMLKAKDQWEIVELAWPRDGTGSKYDRIQRLEPDFRAGTFYMAAVTPGVTKNQQRVIDMGQSYRVFSPVKRYDEVRAVYALNKTLLDEYLVYPFSVHDDFLDACSRIYDIEAVPPILIDESSLEPEAYTDAA
jgi:hypothetical protein